MTATFDKVLTLLTGIGIFGFLVYNAKSVTTLANGLTGSAVTYVSGIRGTQSTS